VIRVLDVNQIAASALRHNYAHTPLPAAVVCRCTGSLRLLVGLTLGRFYLLVRFFDPPFEKSRVPSEKKF
jgi:hypothetical protein